jgi:hypothetical protein
MTALGFLVCSCCRLLVHSAIKLLFKSALIILCLVALLAPLPFCSRVQYNGPVKTVSDKDIIETTRKYNLDPNSMKCEAFALFDQGYSTKEVRFLLRKYRDPYYPQSFSSTIRRYYLAWKAMQKR